jgi:hypothetical protein
MHAAFAGTGAKTRSRMRNRLLLASQLQRKGRPASRRPATSTKRPYGGPLCGSRMRCRIRSRHRRPLIQFKGGRARNVPCSAAVVKLPPQTPVTGNAHGCGNRIGASVRGLGGNSLSGSPKKQDACSIKLSQGNALRPLSWVRSTKPLHYQCAKPAPM